MKTGFLPLVAAGVLGGGMTAAALLGTGAAGNRMTSTVIQAPPLATASPSGSTETALTAREIYRREAPGVVLVRARSVQAEASSLDLSGRSENVATGSGFVIDEEGHLLTNAHIVAGATDIEITFDDRTTVDAQVLGKDERTDLALLAVDPAGVPLHPLPLGESRSAEVGDPAVAIANPFGKARTLATGVLAAKQQRVTAASGFAIDGVLQTDMPVTPGGAGGPLIDSTGRVIGVNSQIAAGPGGGVGFAVPIDTAKAMIPRLEAHLVVSHAYLGIRAGGDDLVALDSGTRAGVRVEEVDPEGPAGRAGILGRSAVNGGDVITAIDGRPVRSMADIEAVVQRHRPGDGVAVDLLRDGEPLTVQVELTERPAAVPMG